MTQPRSSLSDRLSRAPAVSPSQADHARRLVADWQLLADLSFADLTLWVPLAGGAWWCVAQVRPLTAPTTQPEDLVGVELAGADAASFVQVHQGGEPVVEEPDGTGNAPRSREVLPVRHEGAVVAVLARDRRLSATGRRPSWSSPTWTSRPSWARWCRPAPSPRGCSRTPR